MEKIRKNELPQHHVELTRGFWLATKEVTNREFESFVNTTGYRTDAEKEGWANTYHWDQGKWKKTEGACWRKPGWDIEPDFPVVCVSWNDAMAYCRWLSMKTGEHYCLLTEAQWEYACRTGTEYGFFWGYRDDGGQGYLNAADETPFPDGNHWVYGFPFSDGYWAVAPVGSYKPNPWGLYDMLGNVQEWCADRYGRYEDGTLTAPTGSSSGKHRVIRGGSWDYSPDNCWVAARDDVAPNDRHSTVGFRVMRTP